MGANLHETLGTDVVRQDLDRVGNQETRPGEVVGRIVDENHSNHGTSGGLRFSHGELGRARRPNNEGYKHPCSGGQEKRTTTKLVDRESEADSNAPIPDGETAVDLELGVGICDTNSIHDILEVVRDEAVARPLREQTGSHDQQESVAVTPGGDELPPAGAPGRVGLELDGLLDLLVLELDERVGGITVGMVLGKDLQGLLWLVLGHEPTGRLGDHPQSGELDNRGKCLHDGRGSPRPIAVDFEGTIGDPGGNDSADVPCSVVEGSDSTTVLGMAQFGKEERSRGLGNRASKADEETGTNEHAKVLRSGLEGNAEHHKKDAGNNGQTTAKVIGDVRREGKTTDRSNTHNGIEKTQN